MLMCHMTDSISTQQSGLDPMHLVDLGIWGHHLLLAMATKIDQALRGYSILQSKDIDAVWNELEQRASFLEREHADDCMFRVNSYKIRYMERLLQNKMNPQHKEKSCRKLQAWEHHLLMLVSLVYST